MSRPARAVDLLARDLRRQPRREHVVLVADGRPDARHTAPPPVSRTTWVIASHAASPAATATCHSRAANSVSWRTETSRASTGSREERLRNTTSSTPPRAASRRTVQTVSTPASVSNGGTAYCAAPTRTLSCTGSPGRRTGWIEHRQHAVHHCGGRRRHAVPLTEFEHVPGGTRPARSAGRPAGRRPSRTRFHPDGDAATLCR